MNDDLTPCWRFQKAGALEKRRDPSTVEFFKDEQLLDSVLRESIQNSLDARNLESSGPVRVRIAFSRLRRATQEQSAFFDGLHGHLSSKGGIEGGRKSVDEIFSGDFAYFVIEDFNTTGLTGPIDFEDETSNFYAYFLKDNGTEKGTGKTLGSRGIGKAVFQKASKIRSSFAYSVRRDDSPAAFLAGNCTLKFHDVDGATYRPDGWFALDDALRPVSDAGTLESFRDAFGIVRTDEPGMSLVIPFLDFDEDISTDTICLHILSNFLVAIATGALEVEVSDRMGARSVLSKAILSNASADSDVLTRSDVLALIDEAGPDESPLSPDHLSMLEDWIAAKGNDTREIRLAKTDDNRKKGIWADSIFWQNRLEAMRTAFATGASVVVKVPFFISPKAPAIQSQLKESFFHVVLRKNTDKQTRRFLFYRLGLWISGVNRLVSTTRALGLVLVEDTEAVRFLSSAESAAHNNWSPNEDAIKNRYSKPKVGLDYVKDAPQEILTRIDTGEEPPDEDFLRDLFFVENNDAKQKPNSRKKPPKPGPGPKPTPPGPDIPSIPSPNRPFEIHLLTADDEKAYGIEVTDRRDCPDGIPCRFRTSFRYLNEDGEAHYDPLDFKLPHCPAPGERLSAKQERENNENPVKIDILEAERNNVVVRTDDNRLEVEILAIPFHIRITGFDPNLDVGWTTPKIVRESAEQSEEDDQ